MGLQEKKNIKEKKTNYKIFKYVDDENKKGVIVSANNPAHAMQLLAEKLEKKVDKTKIVEVVPKEEPTDKNKKGKKN